MSAPLVVFDLDGTLIDTAPDLIDSLNYTIEAVGLAPVTFDDLTHLVGQGVKVMIQRAFELRREPLDEVTAAKLFDRYMEHYQANMPGKSLPYTGLLECLDRLEAAGMRFAICTNKGSQLTTLLMDKLELSHRFAAMTCGDTFAFRKPDGRHVLQTVELAGGDPLSAIMVGDSINDILAAQNAGVPAVAVTFGYSDVAVDQLNPDRIIESYADLTPDMVLELLDRGAERSRLAR